MDSVAQVWHDSAHTHYIRINTKEEETPFTSCSKTLILAHTKPAIAHRAQEGEAALEVLILSGGLINEQPAPMRLAEATGAPAIS